MSPLPRRDPQDSGLVPSLDAVADELYGLPPEEFIAARTHWEKAARQGGDRAQAASIRALAKPSVTAWLANRLARERRDELAPLLELGASLREATAQLAGDDLRRLSRQQHEIVYALIQQARQIARAHGRSVSDDAARGLEDTLHAALADEGAAQQLLAARLTKPLPPPGFGGGQDGAAADKAAPRATAEPVRKTEPATKAKPATKTKPAAADVERRRKADRDLAEASSALVDATGVREQAQALLAEADQAVDAAAQEVEQAQRQVEQAQRQVEQAQRQLDEAHAAATDADRRRREQTTALRQAERAVSAAERRRADAELRRDGVAADA